MTETTITAVAPPHGLSEDEAGRRLAARGPVESPATSRSYSSIVRGQRLHDLQPVQPPLLRPVAAPTPGMMLISAAGAALALTALWLTDERFVPGRGS